MGPLVLLHLPAQLVAANSNGHVYGNVQGGWWINTEKLIAGQRLMTANGGVAEVVTVEIEDTPLKAYNLTVADFHTFFVREAGNDNALPVWVHNCAVGYAADAVDTAFDGMRGGGGHAIRHLQGNLIPNTGSLSSRLDAFKDLARPILTNPSHAADWRVGATPGRAFLGEVNGSPLAVVVAKSGPYQGSIISSFVPDANQLNLLRSR